MAHLFKHLINRKQSYTTRLISTLNLTPQLFSNPQSILNHEIISNPRNGVEFEPETQLRMFQIDPKFSSGYCLNPISSSGFHHCIESIQSIESIESNPRITSSSGFETHMRKSQIYPSFSIGYFLNPVLSTGFGLSEVQDSEMMWADSVKKKKKRKRNKHKHKKLLKALRRKTKN